MNLKLLLRGFFAIGIWVGLFQIAVMGLRARNDAYALLGALLLLGLLILTSYYVHQSLCKK